MDQIGYTVSCMLILHLLFKIPVDISGAHAGLPGDLGDAHVEISRLGKQAGGGREDFGAAFGAHSLVDFHISGHIIIIN